MKITEERKVTISEIILAIVLLLTLFTEHIEGKINDLRYQMINKAQLASNIGIKMVDFRLSSFENIFDRNFHLPLIPLDTNIDKEGIDPVALSLSEDFRNKKISSDEYAEKLAKQSGNLAQQAGKSYFYVIEDLQHLQGKGQTYEYLLNVGNFLKFILILIVMLIQISLFKSLRKRTRTV